MRNLIVGVMFALLAACASGPGQKSNGDRLADLEATLSGLYVATAHLKDTGRITQEQGANFFKECENVEDLMRLARIALIQPGDETAAARISTLSVALTNLDARLRAAQKGQTDPLTNSPALGGGPTVLRGAGVQ